jgi:hypothetical protein
MVADATAVVGAALTVYVPAPPVPETKAVMVVPGSTFAPEMTMPTTSAPDVTLATVSVVVLTGMEPTTTGAETAAMEVPPATATVGAALTVHVHGTLALAHEPPTIERTVVPATTLVPESVMPTRSVPDATAVTVSVVELTGMPPVTVAVGKVGATPMPAGQKKPAGHVTCEGPPEKRVQ